ncbi:MAG: diguanylate cyclase [Rhodobacteraceae bacterium]|nr:diguanylate cyclase [Paracoccaceae bacterium]
MKRLLTLPHLWLFPLLFWAAVLGASLSYNLAAIDRHVADLAIAQGRDVFRMVQAMRRWNAEHGGVYVRRSEISPPNPYLDVPYRDLLTRSGDELTLVNPAYMTRQVAEWILSEAHIRVRMSSLIPMNPLNHPDDWERAALESFAQGARERAEILANGSGRELRYMAPLMTETACLECHAKQGYKVGDIRGGISVSFSAEATMASAQPQKQTLWLMHALAWAVLSGLGVFALTRIRDLMLTLEAARQEQESLVEKRTAELKTEVRERRRAERRLHYLVDSTAQGMLGVDLAGKITFCNRHAQNLLASLANQGELLGKPILDIFTDDPEFANGMAQAKEGSQSGGRLTVKHPLSGLEYSLEYMINTIHSDGHVSGCVVSLNDVTVRQQQEEEMWRQANFDPLTELPNRSMFASRMAALMQAGAVGEHAAVLFIDLDDFKPVNDQYGHQAGDVVLVEIAHRLQADIRESDFAARIGGDEFVVVLAGNGSREQTARVAEKLLQSLARPISISGGHQVRVSASIGISTFPEDGANIDTLLRNADFAMYQAKEKQKGSYGFYDPDSNH